MSRQAFVGPFIHIDENGALVTSECSTILVENGKIVSVTTGATDDHAVDKTHVLSDGQFMIPGFIDCHIHPVQLPNLGIGYDKCLLDWLDTYTFPLETKYTNPDFAKRTFKTVVRQTIKTGTTTACYFASLYSTVSAMLAREVTLQGQRALIGKVNMNSRRNDGYYETTEASIRNTMNFIEEIEQMKNPLIKPIITPRFALSCDMELMQALGRIAREKDLHIQGHISENEAEIKAVLECYKEPSYAAVYDTAGLLTNKTVMAHGVHLTDSDLALLKERGTAVIHCPASNTFLKSGLCDVQRLKTKKIKIGLGTDISGGPSYSMLDAMKSALQVSYHLSILKNNYQPLSYKDVFHMATLGGANALAIDDKVGNLMADKEFDVLIIDLNAPDSILYELVDIQATLEEKLERFIYSGDDRNIVSAYISGKKVK